MTTINQTALLNAAVVALVSAVADLKKAGVEHIGLGTEIVEGVKYRDLKNWLKEFKAKQKDVTPAPKATETKPSAKATDSKSPAGVRDLELSKSSNIESATYDRANKTMRVTFKNGAVYDYAGVGIREANAFEKAESAGTYFKDHIKGHKDVTKVKGPGKTAASAPAPKAEPRTKRESSKLSTISDAINPKSEKAPVAYTASELRGAELLNGRKVEKISKVVTNKNTGNREVITESGARYEIANLRRNNRGRFVFEAEAKPATKAEETVKAPRGNRKANLADAAKEQANNTRKSKPVPAMPKAGDVRGQQVRIIKGSKDKMVKVLRIVTRDEQRVALTENGFALPFGQIIFNDDQLTYMGKLTAEQFRAA